LIRLLLDTHIWLWSRLAPAHLGRRLSRALEDKANELWLSPLSIWETLLLAENGRISLAPTAQEWVAVALLKVPMKEAPLTSEVALATQHIHLPHRDPVDHFLAASARVFDLTLVTADRRLLRGTGFTCLPNR
jgi:PIN domain nuclease of toxin-antitoxin system